MMRAIVTMEFIVPPERVEAQHKPIQHKGATEHQGAVAGLRARGDAGSLAISDMMEAVLASRAA